MLDDTDTKDEMPHVDVSEIDRLNEDELRVKVREFVDTNSTSLKSVALMAGIGESTFTAWLGAKYRGDNDKITDKARSWLKNETALGRRRLGLPAHEKFAKTRSAAKIISALEHAQAVPALVAIVGAPGVGKTTALDHYRETRPNVWKLTAQPLVAGAFAIMEYLREEIGVPQTAPHRVARAIATKLQGTQGLVIIDEIQHLDIKAIDQLRSLFDIAKIGMAFCGNEESLSRIDGGERKAQLAQVFSRVGLRVIVPRPDPKDADALLDMAEIAEPELRKYLKWLAGRPGALRGMMNTLKIAQMVANGAQETLAMTHLTQAWTRRSGTEVLQ